jgi:hypothetical protein
MRKKSKSADPRQLCLIDWIEEQIRKEQATKAKPAFNAEYLRGPQGIQLDVEEVRALLSGGMQ